MNVFGVLTIHRKYYFQAGSPEDMLGWIHALREACQAATGRRSSAKEGDDTQEITEKPVAHRRSLLPSWATPSRPSADSANNPQGAARIHNNALVNNRSETSINTAMMSHTDDTTSVHDNGHAEPILQGYLTKLSQNSKVGVIRVRPVSLISTLILLFILILFYVFMYLFIY
jgi:hypothetical protein